MRHTNTLRYVCVIWGGNVNGLVSHLMVEVSVKHFINGMILYYTRLAQIFIQNT